MSEHTPGPWHIQYGGLSETDEGFGVASKIEPGIVAECYPPAADAERRRRLLADARLIAAAPEMLRILRETRYLLRGADRSQKFRDHCSATVSDITNLIDRIEGSAS